MAHGEAGLPMSVVAIVGWVVAAFAIAVGRHLLQFAAEEVASAESSRRDAVAEMVAAHAEACELQRQLDAARAELQRRKAAPLDAALKAIRAESDGAALLWDPVRGTLDVVDLGVTAAEKARLN